MQTVRACVGARAVSFGRPGVTDMTSTANPKHERGRFPWAGRRSRARHEGLRARQEAETQRKFCDKLMTCAAQVAGGSRSEADDNGESDEARGRRRAREG